MLQVVVRNIRLGFGSKTVHKFTGTGPFSTPSTFNKTCDYTIIGGGGGSNYDGGGGGGAGGWREGTEPVGGDQDFTVTIGGGGAQVLREPLPERDLLVMVLQVLSHSQVEL